MSEQKLELKRCSRCHSKLLLKYFSKNRCGELYKLCDNCRHKTPAQEKVDKICKRICQRCHFQMDLNAFGFNPSGGVYRLCKECRDEKNKRNLKDICGDHEYHVFVREFDERLNHAIQTK